MCEKNLVIYENRGMEILEYIIFVTALLPGKVLLSDIKITDIFRKNIKCT